jgi:hypothetical protein
MAELRQKPASASNARDYVGAHDVADCQRIVGWAWNRAQPYKALAVDIYDGNALVATAPAASLRVDVFLAGYGSGYSGFDLTTPAALKDGRTHIIRVKFAGTSLDLASTPKSLVCAP